MNIAYPGHRSYRAEPGNFQPLTGPADIIAAAEDRAWFDQRPARAYRLRRGLPGELGMAAGLAVVRSVTPGFRLRVPIPADRQGAALLLREVAPRDELCRLLWHRAAPVELVELAGRAIEVAADHQRRRAMN